MDPRRLPARPVGADTSRWGRPARAIPRPRASLLQARLASPTSPGYRPRLMSDTPYVTQKVDWYQFRAPDGEAFFVMVSSLPNGVLHRGPLRDHPDSRTTRPDGARGHARRAALVQLQGTLAGESRDGSPAGALMQFAIQVGGGQVRHDQSGIDAIVEETQLAESLGFDVVFVPDHYVFESLGTLRTETPAYEMFFVMATLAQRTGASRSAATSPACCSGIPPCTRGSLLSSTRRAVARRDRRRRRRLDAGRVRDDGDRVSGRVGPAAHHGRGRHRHARALARRAVHLRGAVLPGDRCGVHAEAGPEARTPLMLGGSGNGILRRAGAWADIIHMVPVIGAAGTTTLDEIRKFDDAGLPERLARVRAAEAKAGRRSGSVRFASTIFTYCAPADSAARTRGAGRGPRQRLRPAGGRVAAAPDRTRRHAGRDDRGAAPARARARPLAPGAQLHEPRAAARLRRARVLPHVR